MMVYRATVVLTVVGLAATLLDHNWIAAVFAFALVLWVSIASMQAQQVRSWSDAWQEFVSRLNAECDV